MPPRPSRTPRKSGPPKAFSTASTWLCKSLPAEAILLGRDRGGAATFGAAEAAAGRAADAWLDPGADLCAGPGCCGGRSASR
ncbi:MAG: hypothetical protein ACKN89_17060 [Cyanobium sp.]